MVQTIIESHFGKDNILSITPLAMAGSNRNYFRIILNNKESFIACHNNHIAENETFFYFTEIFSKTGINIPSVIFISEGRNFYIQTDLGNDCLLDIVLKNSDLKAIELLYQKTLQGLISMQIEGGNTVDFTKCFSSQKFDKNAVLADLNYFKYYFLDLNEIEYNRQDLQSEFEQLAISIQEISPTYFMFRDFQGRNIMMVNGTPYFIDYQGAMEGPLQYDVASLLWQAKAALPFSLKEDLYKFYKKELAKQIVFEENEFDKNYYKVLLVRLLQVLGAYGLRGIIEQRSHFLSSIPYGLKNIDDWLSTYFGAIEAYPTLKEILKQLTSMEIKSKYSIESKKLNSPLKVIVQSFSYKKGIPTDQSGNGGGFMFDCRGILNPGRFEEYKKLTGRDKPVIDFLESKTKINEFLNHAKKIVDISVKDYIERGFEHLQISFGCTGGQHRSVYCTDAMTTYLNEKYGIEVEVKHLIQDEKNWTN